MGSEIMFQQGIPDLEPSSQCAALCHQMVLLWCQWRRHPIKYEYRIVHLPFCHLNRVHSIELKGKLACTPRSEIKTPTKTKISTQMLIQITRLKVHD